MDKADGRTDEPELWMVDGWLELKNDMYPVSFNAVLYGMVILKYLNATTTTTTTTTTNNNNNNNNNNDNNNNNWFISYSF